VAITAAIFIFAAWHTSRLERSGAGPDLPIVAPLTHLPQRFDFNVSKATDLFAWQLAPAAVEGSYFQDDTLVKSSAGIHGRVSLMIHPTIEGSREDRVTAALTASLTEEALAGLVSVTHSVDRGMPGAMAWPQPVVVVGARHDSAALVKSGIRRFMQDAHPRNAHDSVAVANALIRANIGEQEPWISFLLLVPAQELIPGRHDIDWADQCLYLALQDTIRSNAAELCDAAVRFAGARARTARGVLRARSKDLAGAAVDFRAFVDFAAKQSGSPEYQTSLPRARSWLAAISSGRNPITPQVLDSLRTERY